jgi:Zn-finger protein
MRHSFRFFSNSSCEYFPCHTQTDKENFNCLFCFCPLYFLPDCGGSPLYIKGKTKDCSHCPHVHTADGFDFVIGRLEQLNSFGGEQRE